MATRTLDEIIGTKSSADPIDTPDPVLADVAPETTETAPDAPTATGTAAAPVATTDDDDVIPADAEGLKKALQAERKLRKEFKQRATERERELNELRSRPQTNPQTAPVQQQTPPVDPMDEWLTKGPEYVTKTVNDALAAEREARWQDRVAMSQRQMRKEFSDYDEKEQAFLSLAQSQPHLVAQLRAHPFPAEFAYETGRIAIEAQDVGGDLGKWKEKQREQIRQELQREMSGESGDAGSAQAKRSIPKPTIAAARGTGAGSPAPGAKRRSLDEILASGRTGKTAH